MARKWIQKANLKEGAFTSQAKRYGMSVQEYADYGLAHPERHTSTTVRRARLAKTFKKMAR